MQDRITSCALDHYKRTLSKGKPKENSEWTVYAAIIAQRGSKRWVVSCATGTKCTALRAEGCILHDGHAEVLARRGLIRVLSLELCQRIQKEPTKDVTTLLEETENGNFQLRSDTQLQLYISDSPCGDASIYPVDTGSSSTTEEMLFTGAKVVVSKETGIDAIACGGDHQLLDGTAVAREDIQVLGKLRTKSGRSNLPAHLRSTSMSCSDKIVKWCVMGLQGSVLSQYMYPIRLANIVVSRDPRLKDDNDHYAQRMALERAIPKRVQAVWNYANESLQNTKQQKDWRPLLPLVHIASHVFENGKANMGDKAPAQENNISKTSATSNKRKRRDTNKVSPCGFALNWQQSDPTSTEQIIGVRGIRQGKKPKSPEDYQRLASRLSRRELLQLYKKLDSNNSAAKSYQTVKTDMADSDWLHLKSTITKGGPLAGWLRNEQDFDNNSSS